MRLRFNPRAGLIVILARVEGPRMDLRCRLLLDTGSTWTMIKPSILMEIGYEASAATRRVDIVTASRIESAAQFRVSRIRAAGLERQNFPVLCKSLLPEARVDGLLGLDFLRAHKLTLDFRDGEMILD